VFDGVGVGDVHPVVADPAREVARIRCQIGDRDVHTGPCQVDGDGGADVTEPAADHRGHVSTSSIASNSSSSPPGRSSVCHTW
jgi:hypothetical protein